MDNISGPSAYLERGTPMPLSKEMRAYLAERYDCDPHTEILFDGNAISVIGMSPGNNEPEQFFAGYVADIEHEMGIHNDYFGAE
ncbi:hypothetical protein [Bythopirellula polymerisocia]|uniref:Uncharacterized protein n=1 Tax=Bythopirellula polymerisocia TaxID=2528003 RepID=A0A5C6CQ24_9BACT|nr:hypothetical protein [Bythopirellula polymerisocia]TWU25717.1 hypothetical protein Pla144_29270 [Bythopirellula polymerisocia]